MSFSTDKIEQSPDDRIILDGISASQFDLFVNLLPELITNGTVKIRIAPNFRPIFEFEENKILSLLKEKNLPEQCISQLKLDISFMLFGILTGSRGLMISFLTSNVNAKQPKGTEIIAEEKIRSEINTRLNYVEQKIVSADLRRQYAIKNRAKTNVYYDTSWEVVRSYNENDITAPVGLTYTTIRIDMLKASPPKKEESLFLPFGSLLSSKDYDSVVLTMTLQDLMDIIETLNSAAKAVKQTMDSETK